VQQERLTVRVTGDVQVGSADVADQERVAAEEKPRFLCPAPTVCDRVCVMRGRVPRCRDRGDERVPKLDRVAVGQCNVLELDSGAGRQVSGRARARATSSGNPETWSACTWVSKTATIRALSVTAFAR
jgi:hypothetical protein